MIVHGIDTKNISNKEFDATGDAVKLLDQIRTRELKCTDSDQYWFLWCKLRNASNYLVEILSGACLDYVKGTNARTTKQC